MNRLLLLMFGLTTILYGCGRNELTEPIDPDRVPEITRGVFVLNEGDFSGATKATITAYDSQNDKLYQNAFEWGNQNASLGVAGDDIKLYNGYAYIVMSGSDNIIKMSLSNYAKVAETTMPGADPHDLLIDTVRGRLYVSRLSAQSVYALDLNSLARVGDTIRVGANPQGMTLSGNKLYVCNSGFGSGNTVSVIDVSTNRVTATITVSDGPTAAAVAPDGKIWVVCTGNAFGVPLTTGKVFVIDPASNIKTDSISFSENLFGPISIGSDGNAYVLGTTQGSFYGGPVHRVALSSKSVTLNHIIGTYYGLGFDDQAREIYLADAKSFATNGDVKIYSAAGNLRKAFAAQKGPSVFAFRK